MITSTFTVSGMTCGHCVNHAADTDIDLTMFASAVVSAGYEMTQS